MMFDEYHEQIRRAAAAAYPNEAVWLITANECRQVPNIATEPTKTFRVSKQDMARASAAGLLAVVHSHPDFPACPSEADMRGQIATGVPWGIVSTDGNMAADLTWFGDTVERAPLIGRGFRHGVTDCYALIRDYYQLELGITLPEYPRAWNWWTSQQDLYSEGFAAAGFRRIEASEARPGDVWLAQIRSPVTNHGGILLENGLGLHHPSARNPVDPTRLSVREPLARWQTYITHWLRYDPR